MNKLRIAIIALILILLTMPIVLPMGILGAVALHEYLNTGGDGDSEQIYGANTYAMQFTSDATAHTVTKIRLWLKKVGAPGDITVELRTAASDVPNTTDYLAIATYNGDNLGTGYSQREFTMTFTDTSAISGTTQYAIVVKADNGDGSNYVLWQVDAGGGLASAVASKSTDGGVTWASETPKDCLFEVYGDTVLSIVSVKAFQSYLETDDLLITAEVINDYPPYATDTSYEPTQTFAVQLLDLTGTNVLASVPLVSFGDFPESIYLSKSSTDALTIGGHYIFRVIGTFATPPSVTYNMTALDWYGDLVETDYVYFDGWVKSTAQHMEETYGLNNGDLISLTTGSNWALTASGGAYFSLAIPGIMNVRPELFQYAKTKPQFDAGTNQSQDASKTTSQIEAEFETAVGTQLAGVASTFGAWFGLDGYVFFGYILEILILIIVIIGLMAGEGAGAFAIFLIGGVPILFIGNYTHAIGIQWTLILGAAMLFIFVRQFWWKTT